MNAWDTRASRLFYKNDGAKAHTMVFLCVVGRRGSGSEATTMWVPGARGTEYHGSGGLSAERIDVISSSSDVYLVILGIPLAAISHDSLLACPSGTNCSMMVEELRRGTVGRLASVGYRFVD
ncbi:hypothetical protein RRF57_012718 [Xylaria bambusicola]|uniref:Uncharacterized protein n=1 Tax=Xylaria bambusicola TaxID=326684 RepID=A0AAN7V220_9PEZI